MCLCSLRKVVQNHFDTQPSVPLDNSIKFEKGQTDNLDHRGISGITK